ncbi:MAG TPA: DUF2764 domain-containing protein [Planctomycetaceae bacterium]|nr:DUF2764 domain-containing protein [Planctomycetaceae bacterium]
MHKYFTLIASLPNLPRHFDVEHLPITRQSLKERLEMLTPEDRALQKQLAEFFDWDRQPLDRSDNEFARELARIETIEHSLIRRIVRSRMEVRTIVSALRRRLAGGTGPVPVGSLAEHIARNWDDPTFKLGSRLPWVERFSSCLIAGDTMNAEQTLLGHTWQAWCTLATEFTFSFEAVILYVARWEILYRWHSRNVSNGQQRFDSMIEETLGGHAELQF